MFCDAQFQLIRIELRVPEYGWTTQKVFHLMNFIVNGGEILAALVPLGVCYYGFYFFVLRFFVLYCCNVEL